jgi:amidase
MLPRIVSALRLPLYNAAMIAKRILTTMALAAVLPAADRNASQVLAQKATQTAAQTAESATKAAITRVQTIDPRIHAVIALDPTALDKARGIDGKGGARGLLCG